MDIFYEKDGDDFVLVSQDSNGHREVLATYKAVAVAYTYARERDSYLTHRHGSPETIQRWVEEQTRKLRAHIRADDPLLEDLLPHVIASDAWDVDELNWVIENINGLNRLVEEKELELCPSTSPTS